MFGSIGFTELILILVIVLIIFGAGKLPQLGEGLGKAIKGFKKSVHEADAIEAEAQAQAQAQVASAPQGQPTPVPPQSAAAPQPVEASALEQSAASVSPPSKA
jgi:sec-independent protein translocase protein TatA